MDAITGFFKGSAPDNEPSPSVLSEWQRYSGSSGAPTGSQADRLLESAEEGASTVSKLMSGALSTVANAATGAASSVTSGVQNIPSTTQWVYFAALAGSGALFLLLSFFVFLPMIILVPSKFAITFSLGSALILASLGALKGWQQMFGSMASREQLPYTAAYVASLLGTLYASLILKSYILSLLMCVVQVVTLVYYAASFFPGGASSAGYVFGLAGRGGLSLGGAVLRGVFSR